MRPTLLWGLLLGLVLGLVLGQGGPALAAATATADADASVATATATAGGDASVADIEQSIERARVKLDEAAQQLAELHTRLWSMETSGPRSEKPMLGILLKDGGSGPGLTLAGVTPDGGAERAGLKAGDTVIEVNGVRLDGGGPKQAYGALNEAMASVTPGDAVTVGYLRDGASYDAQVVTQSRGSFMVKVVKEKGPWLESLRALGDLDPLEALQGLEELHILDDLDLELDLEADLDGRLLRAPAGLRLESIDGSLADYFQVDRGVLVLAAPARDPALQAGDVLLSVADAAVTDPADALRRLASASGKIPVRVKRQGREQALDVDADALNAEKSLHLFNRERVVRIDSDEDGQELRLEIVIDPGP
ncbi:MAG: PDZ domain-containing protein [Pseudomonadales bacterium]